MQDWASPAQMTIRGLLDESAKAESITTTPNEILGYLLTV